MFYEGFDHEQIFIYPVENENFTTLDKTLLDVVKVGFHLN